MIDDLATVTKLAVLVPFSALRAGLVGNQMS